MFYKVLSRFLLLVIVGVVISGRNVETSLKKPWQLREALYLGYTQATFNATWISNSELYYMTKDNNLNLYDVTTQNERMVIPKKIVDTYSQPDFKLSPDKTKCLVSYNADSVFRHSSLAQYDIYHIQTRKIEPIHGGKKLSACIWSPVGNRIAYVYKNNVYIHFEDGLEYPVTTEGVDGVVYNGIADWVYEEEVLQTGTALWWSPDGTKIAIGFFDDSDVRTYSIPVYDSSLVYPREINVKYPKPGTPNPKVFLKVFDINAPRSYFIFRAPVNVVSGDHIFQNVAWSNDTHLIITWLNRRQNIASIESCSHKGVCLEVKRLEEPNGWIVMDTPKCYDQGRHCLFTHWIDNWYQIWNLNMETGQNIWRSRGNFTVVSLFGYDDINDDLYYSATLPDDPTQVHVYRNDNCLSCNLVDEQGDSCLTATASFSPDYSYYVLVCQGPKPSYVRIYEKKTDSQVALWDDSTLLTAVMKKKLLPTVKILNVTLGGGFTGYVKLLLPPGLDWENPDKKVKYPMIVKVYGGPNSQMVTNAFTVGYEMYLTTSRNVIYVNIDGRGTGRKGKDLLFSVNNNLGEHEVEDQMAVTKFLQDKYSFIDSKRTGVWGWSYGGYLSAKILANDSSNVFRCGASVAPVTSWRFYDTIYTERFMGLPTKEDNLANYEYSSVMKNIENFRIHDFLLIHGTGDDNVHLQNSLVLARNLQEKDIFFKEMFYTDANHAIPRTHDHVYNTIDRFFEECLNLDRNEKNDFRKGPT